MGSGCCEVYCGYIGEDEGGVERNGREDEEGVDAEWGFSQTG